jgi:hypothetical protein
MREQTGRVDVIIREGGRKRRRKGTDRPCGCNYQEGGREGERGNRQA